ncbi:MAG: XRE family transcriptional regulator [Bacteroidetes bacterium]|nr:MAG: XRE family transcriptional regulator [Bacteroidota bacterium]
MLKEGDIVKLIFGLKVQDLRQAAGLSYQQLSDRTGLAISYLHGIEKGKKYPKADKILALAKALDTHYDYLVSLEPNKRLRPVIELLRSDFLKIFPLETFGISTTKLLELLVQAPEKVNAFIGTIIKITRNFNLQGEDFYKSALRSYQDLHDNYFPELEQAAASYRRQHNYSPEQVLSIAQLRAMLQNEYGIQVDRTFLASHPELRHLRSVYVPDRKQLYLGERLDPAQERFLLAKELGFQCLQLAERPLETRMLEVDSFEKLLANFYASYFAVALLLPETSMIKLLQQMRTWERWQGAQLLEFLDTQLISSEMFLQRMANVLPYHFGIRQLFFLRFYNSGPDRKFVVTKEMHLSQLHDPYANQLDEHYCRRWISISLIRKLQIQGEATQPLVGAQISRYWNTPNAYFCICFAKPTRDNWQHSSSVTLGLRVNEQLLQVFPFLQHDPGILTRDVHTTCERCPIQDCEARAAQPIFWQRQQQKAVVLKHLRELLGKGE